MTKFKIIWVPAFNFEGVYEVSNKGQIRSIKRTIQYIRKGNTLTAVKPGKLLKQKLTKDGYFLVSLQKNAYRKHQRVHIIILESFLKRKRKENEVTNHKDGIKTNNNINNLEFTTIQNNALHAIKMGLFISPKGEQLSKLTESNIKKIRLLAKTNSQISIAKQFKVGKNCIWNILHNKTWRHVK